MGHVLCKMCVPWSGTGSGEYLRTDARSGELQFRLSSDVTRFCDETRYISSLIFIFHGTLKLSYLADGHLKSPVRYKLPSALVCTGGMLPENKEVTLGPALWLHTRIAHPNGSETE